MAYLQQSVRSDLHHHGVLRHQAEALVEQHGAHQVVDVVVGRAVLSQRRVPLSLRDAGAHPAGGALTWLLNHLHTTCHGVRVIHQERPRF